MGGYTRFLPEEDRHYMTRVQFEAMMASALGGWVAVRLVFGDVSTGASNDIEKATGIARSMVTTYGMSESLGPQSLGQRESATFLHPQAGGQGEARNYSEKVAEAIDAEVHVLIDAAMRQAELILVQHRDVLDALAARLLDAETIEGDELEAVFQLSEGDGTSSEVAVTPMPGYRHRPGLPALLPVPRVAAGLASTTLPEATTD